MKEQEALEILKRDDDEMRKGYFCINDFTALEVAKKALEKQIAKKPIVQGLGQRYCPVCKCGGADHQYCARCGQKLE